MAPSSNLPFHSPRSLIYCTSRRPLGYRILTSFCWCDPHPILFSCRLLRSAATPFSLCPRSFLDAPSLWPCPSAPWKSPPDPLLLDSASLTDDRSSPPAPRTAASFFDSYLRAWTVSRARKHTRISAAVRQPRSASPIFTIFNHPPLLGSLLLTIYYEH